MGKKSEKIKTGNFWEDFLKEKTLEGLSNILIERKWESHIRQVTEVEICKVCMPVCVCYRTR